jgi:hypothetical protein
VSVLYTAAQLLPVLSPPPGNTLPTPWRVPTPWQYSPHPLEGGESLPPPPDPHPRHPYPFPHSHSSTVSLHASSRLCFLSFLPGTNTCIWRVVREHLVSLKYTYRRIFRIRILQAYLTNSYMRIWRVGTSRSSVYEEDTCHMRRRIHVCGLGTETLGSN